MTASTSNDNDDLSNISFCSDNSSSSHFTDSEQGGGGGGNSSGAKNNKKNLAMQEDYLVSFLRVVLICMLLVSTMLVSMAFYFYITTDEMYEFETQTLDQSSKICEIVQQSMKYQLGTIDSFAVALSSYAHYNGHQPSGSTHYSDAIVAGTRTQPGMKITTVQPKAGYYHKSRPKISIPDFKNQASRLLQLVNGGLTLMFLPLVTDEARLEWEKHSSVLSSSSTTPPVTKTTTRLSSHCAHNFGFSEDNEDNNNDNSHTTKSLQSPGVIINMQGEKEEDGSGPYAPLWQIYPPIPLVEHVNLNMLSHDLFSGGLNELIQRKRAVIGEIINTTTKNYVICDDGNHNMEGIFCSSSNSSVSERQGSLSANDDDVVDECHHHGVIVDPMSTILYPVFDSNGKHSKLSTSSSPPPPSSSLAGAFVMIFRWQSYFEEVLGQLYTSSGRTHGNKDTRGLFLVLQNTCRNQPHTFQIINNKNNYQEIEYLGEGDFHDRHFDYMEVSTATFDVPPLNYLNGINDDDDDYNKYNCQYTLYLYPSQEMKNRYITHSPAIYTTSSVLMLVLVSIIFLIYDHTVERRQRVVMMRVHQSSSIIESLFPARVRDRLFLQMQEDGNKNKSNKSNNDNDKNNNIINSNIKSKSFRNILQPASSRKTSPPTPENNYNNDIDTFFSMSIGTTSEEENVVVPPTKSLGRQVSNDGSAGTIWEEEPEFVVGCSNPIADFFPRTTVLFADIVGFTAWSSQREPAQVFVLLQTLYQSFDKIARKRHVFKVETIGDSYVAVTGLPEPQDDDHALIMAKFAIECRHKCIEVTRKLDKSLGPGTSELTMRIGLHSGPVTAGVIQSDRSRFQLFGDTVNTASRMESTGMPDKIQVSKETADLLIGNGKRKWLLPRDELVSAKGKGDLQTYWLQESTSTSSSTRSISLDSSNNNDASVAPLYGRNKHERALSLATLPQETTVARDDLPAIRSRRQLLQRRNSATNRAATSMLVSMPHNSPPAFPRQSSDRAARLIDWNVDLLLGLLRQIVAKRTAEHAITTGIATVGYKLPTSLQQQHQQPEEGLCNYEERYNTILKIGSTVLDEVKEIITLPTFDPEIALAQIDPDSIQLDQRVEDQLHDYVASICSMYRNANPFHNFEHACHVTMSMSKLLKRIISPYNNTNFNFVGNIQSSIGSGGGETSSSSSKRITATATPAKRRSAADLHNLHNYTYGITSDPLTQFSAVFAALIHDVDHTGVSNGQLIIENAYIASVYQNKSVAEQNSLDLAWDELMKPEYEDLRHCIYKTESEFKRFRQLVVNVTLATDIFDKDLSTLRKNRWQKAFQEEQEEEEEEDVSSRTTATSTTLSDEKKNESPVLSVNRKATIVLEHLIQASDVSHTMQHWDIYRKWNERLFYEECLAYESGRTLKHPSDKWYQGEIGFFDNYIIPLARKLKQCGVFGVASDECLNYAIENRKMWQVKGEQIVNEMSKPDYFKKKKQGLGHFRRNQITRSGKSML